jgi:capsular polysaccharide biosynthesis protein
MPAIVVLAFGLLSYRPATPTYNVGVRFIVGQRPAPAATEFDEQRYYNWLASEYIVNGLTAWIRGFRFAEMVSLYLEEQRGVRIHPGAIQSGLAVDNARSEMTISLTAGDPETARQMMDGVIAILTEQNAEALPQLGGELALLTQLDEPIVAPLSPGIRSQLDLPLRLLLALIAGIGLALLAHYLDPTVSNRTELERLGLPVVGEIPGKRSRRK